MTTSKSYYPAIDGIRAIAIMVVVLFHLDISWFKGGFVGVDVFFVISGYLITRNIVLAKEQGTFTFKQFYLARTRRLFPALFVTILLCLLFGVVLLSPDGLIRLSGSAIASALSLANVRFWMGAGYFDVDSVLKPLLHFWSLSVEEQFYLFWPLSLCLILRYASNLTARLLVLSLVALVSLLASQWLVQREPDTAFFLMPFRIYEFTIGALVFFLFRNQQPIREVNAPISTIGTALGLVLILIPAICFNHETPFPGFNALAPCLGTALLIIYRGSKLSLLLLANSPMRALGKISYSLYLVHWPIWVYFHYWRFETVSSSEKLLLLIGMLLLASTLYFQVEKRFRYAQYQTTEGRFAMAGKAGILMVISFALILVVSWLIRYSNGFPERLQANVLAPKKLATVCLQKASQRIASCEFGEQRQPSKRVLLVGDSHALNLRAGLHHYGMQHGVSFHALSALGCPPLIGVYLYYQSLSGPDQHCLDFASRVAAAIDSEKWGAVILVGRWMKYYQHEPYNGREDVTKAFLRTDLADDEIESYRRQLNPSTSQESWRQGLSITIERIHSMGANAIVFSQHPLMHKGLGECNQSPTWLISAENHERRCRIRIPVSEIERRLSITNQSITELAQEKTMVVRPSDYFCDFENKSCRTHNGQRLFYSDHNHLSVVGGKFLIEQIGKDLTDFLGL